MLIQCALCLALCGVEPVAEIPANVKKFFRAEEAATVEGRIASLNSQLMHHRERMKKAKPEEKQAILTEINSVTSRIKTAKAEQAATLAREKLAAKKGVTTEVEHVEYAPPMPIEPEIGDIGILTHSNNIVRVEDVIDATTFIARISVLSSTTLSASGSGIGTPASIRGSSRTSNSYLVVRGVDTSKMIVGRGIETTGLFEVIGPDKTHKRYMMVQPIDVEKWRTKPAAKAAVSAP